MIGNCWGNGYTFESCCINRLPECWDASHTYESCCGAAAAFETELGDPSCWRGQGAFYSYEQCCRANGTHCWGWDARRGMEFSRERCCGVPVVAGTEPGAASKSRFEDASSCNASLREPELAWWSADSFVEGALLQEWTFERLTTVTAVMLFTHPDLLGKDVGWWHGYFDLVIDAGAGMRSHPVDEDLEVSGSGGTVVFIKLQFAPADAYRVRLQLRRWQGANALLYAVPMGCPTQLDRPEVSLVYCWPRSGVAARDVRRTLGLLALMYGWLALLLSAANVGECFLHLDRTLRELIAQGRQSITATVLLSPFLLDFGLQEHGMRIKRAVELFYHHPPEALAVVGFPCAGESGQWTWPMRKVRRQYWKLSYMDYPTGSARRLLRGDGAGACHGGDTVSGSRIYRSQTLSRLLEQIDPVDNAAWLVNLDLEALLQGFGERTFLCLLGVLAEGDYLQHADLTTQLSMRYDVEAAFFHPDVGVRVNCPITVRHQEEQSMEPLVTRRGLVAPWCFRNTLREAWRLLAAWWHGISDANFVVASDGTGLALFRNGREPIPWDLDVDVQLFSEGNARLGPWEFVKWSDGNADLQHQPAALAELRALGFSWGAILDYSSKGAGIHVALQYTAATTRPRPLTLDLDIVLKDHIARAGFPFVASFAGVVVRFGADLQDMLVSKYKSSAKLMRTGRPISCQEAGHNACLPDCKVHKGSPQQMCEESPECKGHGFGSSGSCEACRTAPVAECEFPDAFVELDVFS